MGALSVLAQVAAPVPMPNISSEWIRTIVEILTLGVLIYTQQLSNRRQRERQHQQNSQHLVAQDTRLTKIEQVLEIKVGVLWKDFTRRRSDERNGDDD